MINFYIPLRVAPRFSYYFLISLICIYGGSGLILFSFDFPLPTEFVYLSKFYCLLLIIATATYTIRYHLLLLNHPLYNCVVTHQASVLLVSHQRGQLTTSCFCHPLLIILRVNVENKIHTLIIFADALKPEIFRLLCVHIYHAEQEVD